MRKLAILAGAIALVAISAHTWNALAQEGGVPRPAEVTLRKTFSTGCPVSDVLGRRHAHPPVD